MCTCDSRHAGNESLCQGKLETQLYRDAIVSRRKAIEIVPKLWDSR